MKVLKVDFGGECAGKFDSWTRDFFFAPWKVGSASMAIHHESLGSSPDWSKQGLYREMQVDLIGWRGGRKDKVTGLPVFPMRRLARFFLS